VHAETLRAIRSSAVQDADAARLLYACGKPTRRCTTDQRDGIAPLQYVCSLAEGMHGTISDWQGSVSGNGEQNEEFAPMSRPEVWRGSASVLP
jgi:hypothetical protein